MLILCGPGNNGGDGGVVARHLDLWGYSVRVVWFTQANRLKGDAAVQFEILRRAGFDQACWDDERAVTPERLDALLGEADWVIDALLGTGLTRPVEGILRTVIEAVNRSGKPILALDLPSGLDADSGQPLGVAVHAQATVTFVAPKRGFAAPGADAYTGTVTVVDIGVPRVLGIWFLGGPPRRGKAGRRVNSTSRRGGGFRAEWISDRKSSYLGCGVIGVGRDHPARAEDSVCRLVLFEDLHQPSTELSPGAAQRRPASTPDVATQLYWVSCPSCSCEGDRPVLAEAGPGVPVGVRRSRLVEPLGEMAAAGNPAVFRDAAFRRTPIGGIVIG